MEKIDIIIVGAGIGGLAVAEAVSRMHPDKEVILIEKHSKFGQEASSRNSEVIHAGMYFPTLSLKARMCVRGNKMLYDFCDTYQVPYRKIGKLIISRDAKEEQGVRDLYDQGRRNGVPGLSLMTQDEVREMEPNIFATGAMYSETTGIVDTHQVMARLEYLATQQGVMMAYNHEVTRVEKTADGFAVHFINAEGEDALETKYLFNCAGLYSDMIPEQLGINVDDSGYRIHPNKGEYFSLPAGKAKLTSHLIYTSFYGLHICKGLDGLTKLGPSTFYVDDKNDYDVDPNHLDEFYQSGKTYLPWLEREDLQADMSGIRAKLQGPSDPKRDFIIRNEEDKGLCNLIDLVGIESPGVTAALANAEYAVSLMQ